MASTHNLKVLIPSTFPLILATLTVFTMLTATASAQNPVPFVDQPLVPDATTPGGAAFTLTVNGSGFVSVAVVNWNGRPRVTHFVSSSQLMAKILASDIATASTAAVTVVNPTPGGGISNAQFFSIVAPGVSVSFLPAATYRSGGYGNVSVAVADVNGDGKPDLLIANEGGEVNGDGSVGVLLGNGDGTFQRSLSYDSGGYAGSVLVADVNGDGKPDLIVGNAECPRISGSCVGVLIGNGDGTFKTPVVYSSGGGSGAPFGSPLSIAVVDVNGDGKPDLLVANPCAANNASCSEGSVGVLLGNGDGTFQPAVSYESGGYVAGALAVADLRGNGKLDLIVTNCDAIGSANCIAAGAGNGVVGVLLGNGDGTFQTVKTYSSGTAEWVWTPVVVADVNGDGKPDLLIANEGGDDGNGEGSAGVLLGNGDGTFRSVVTYDSGGDWATSIAVADVNADGKPDLVLANFSGSMGVLLGKGDGTFQPPKSYPAGTVNHSISVVVNDVNGDGIQDAVVMTWGPVEVLLGNDDGTFQEAQSYPSGAGPFIGNGGPVLAVGDLSSNGRADLVVANNGEVGVLLNNTERGKSATATALASSLNPSVYGQRVTWTATVSSSRPSAPTGKVNFVWGIYSIGAATLNAGGVATLTRANLNADAYPLTAVYEGDANNLRSTSAILNQVVQKTTSAATLAFSPNPSTQTETFTAKITSPTVTPTGPVIFTVGKKTLGTVQLAGGEAKLTVSTLAVGSNTVTVTYNGDSNIAGSSAWVTQTFVMPVTGTLYLLQMGGSAGGITEFGLGTSPANFVQYYSGLPNNPNPIGEVLVLSFTAGTIVNFGMFTQFNGASGWAFSTGTNQASIVAFDDIDNSLGMNHSITQQTSPTTWLLHLDDALSYLYDDDNNDVLMQIRVAPQSTQ